MAIGTIPPVFGEAPLSVATLGGGGLRDGQTIEARVLERVSADILRLATSSGRLDVVLPKSGVPGLPQPGSIVHLQVGHASSAGTPILQFIDGPARGLTVTVRQSEATRPQPTPAPQAQPVPARTEAAPASPAAQALESVVTRALQRQNGAAPLFATAEALLAAPPGTVPRPVAAALQALLGLRLGDGRPVTPETVRDAFRASGVFAPPPTAPGRPPADLKAALTTLRTVLGTWLATPAPNNTPKPTAPQTGSPQSQPPAGSAVPPASTATGQAAGAAVRPGLPGMPLVPALPLVPVPIRDAATTGTEAVDAEPGTPDEEPLLLRQPLEVRSDTAKHLPPPHRGFPPEGQPAQTAVPPGDAEAVRSLAARALEEADHAAARVVLHQAASLDPANPEIRPARDGPAHFSFEIPLAGPTGTSIADVRVERDARRGAGAEGDGRTWRVQIAFAVDPLGPVQARIGLLPGHRIAVALWCERPEAVASLEDMIAELRTGLQAAGLEVAAIDLRLGRPPETAAPTSGGLHRIDRSL
ncbi:flagellar hook-length control protein FliK [Chthonobacter albigriseus]|uniref:flagellar hook-length control protein FliK n=1 Tax=Chthonobacter albigriseus TaxID=1683161 RepID=UPI0015EF4B32|nr:flagellar hook-length control protein FliK [Chthonobacter albigriseus]